MSKGKEPVPAGELLSDDETLEKVLLRPRPPPVKTLGQSGSGTKRSMEEVIMPVLPKKKRTVTRLAQQDGASTGDDAEEVEMEDTLKIPITGLETTVAMQELAPRSSPPLKLPRFKLKKTTK
jgi:hypothetical protein